MNRSETFIAARNSLWRTRLDLNAAQNTFAWPRFESFNWAREYFDYVAAGNNQPALQIVSDSEPPKCVSYSEMSRRSTQVAHFLKDYGLRPGDRLLISLGNCVELWEATLAAIKLGITIIPTSTLMLRDELRDRVQRGRVDCVITHDRLTERYEGLPSNIIKISIGVAVQNWAGYENSAACTDAPIIAPARDCDETLLLYFTSGTTAKAKLVQHSHVSYPIGHLSTMYWLGLQKGDVHLNLSSPGWAKHAWSCVFAPWNAQSCVLAYQYERFEALKLLSHIVRQSVTNFCAPPTVWRLLVQEDLKRFPVKLREVTSAGEPLNAEIIDQVREAWNLTIRDGFGQTETTAVIANSPSQDVKPGSMGRPLPGFRVVLIDPDGRESAEGEICIDLSNKPIGIMTGYADDPQRTENVLRNNLYHTSDIATRDEDGYLTFVGRSDDVFKSSDYRISPFELESVLIEHAAVAEAAVVPSPDRLRLAVPKAYIHLAPGYPPTLKMAQQILEHVRKRVAPYKRIRRVEFAALPKTISGKIRRSELRQIENERADTMARRPNEYWEGDFNVEADRPQL